MDTTPVQSSQPNQRPPRKHFTPEQRRAFLERFHQSGLTQTEFVAREGISQAALGKWLQAQRRQAREQPQTKPATFQELTLAGIGGGWALEVSSPKNWTLRLAQAPRPAVL